MKWEILAVASLVVISMLVYPVIALSTTISIEDIEVAPGGSATVPIYIYDVTDPDGVGTVQLDLLYNASMVQITGTDDSNSNFIIVTPNVDNTNGIFTLGGMHIGAPPGPTGDVRVIDVTFTAVGSAGDESLLNIANTLLKDATAQQNDIPHDVDDGNFTIEVNNPPVPKITNPQDGATLSGLVTIEEIDESGEGDIVYNLFEYYYDENCDCVDNDENEWHEIGNDTSPAGGWSVEWDTTARPDCCYMVRATMGDEQGQTGQDEINVVLSNHDPVPVITNPQDGDTLSGVVTIEEVDDSFDNGADIVYNLFKYYYDENCDCVDNDENEWHEIGNDTSPAGGWSVGWNTTQYPDCCYMIRATMGDKHGRTGTTEINVKIDNTPPVVTNGNATPLVIPDDTDNEPKWGENATLNVTVNDHSSVYVTINLSAIGGPAVQPMTNIEGNIWSVTTNASNGTAGWNGTAYEPYQLQVNATDITGKSNISVSIESLVMNNGDVNEDGSVDFADVTYLANHVVSTAGYESMEDTVADVNGDSFVDFADATYLANHVVSTAGYEELK
jgi:hypothetical protein